MYLFWHVYKAGISRWNPKHKILPRMLQNATEFTYHESRPSLYTIDLSNNTTLTQLSILKLNLSYVHVGLNKTELFWCCLYNSLFYLIVPD